MTKARENENTEVETKMVTSVRVTTATMDRVSVLQQVTRDGRKKRTYDKIIDELVIAELKRLSASDEKAATVISVILDDAEKILSE